MIFMINVILKEVYVFTMGVLVCSGLHALLVLRVAYGWEYLLLLAIATFGSDTGAILLVWLLVNIS
ncbi:MAG: hypothetical protein ACLR43_00905 [Faecalibacillus faecis]